METKTTKPFYKKGWFIIVCALFILGAIFGDKDKSSGSSSSSSSSSSYSEPTPSLCDCLKNPDYAQPGTEKYKKCKEVFMNQYGTSEPSTDAMSNDYYNCN